MIWGGKMIKQILGKKNVKITYEIMKKKYLGKENILRELNDFFEYFNLNKEFIMEKIIKQQYEADDVYLKEIINYKGKKRLISNLSMKDKFISRAIMRVLDIRISNSFSSKSFAYQRNKGVVEELELIKKYINDGNILCR